MFSLLECKSGVTNRMEHAGFCSSEELIVEPFTEATTVTEHSLGERKRRAGVRHACYRRPQRRSLESRHTRPACSICAVKITAQMTHVHL
jgi:5-methylcytosine-specific restriction endonuclease McrA